MVGGLANGVQCRHKCSVMHFGFNNNGSDLTLIGRIREVHESEKDLGVMVQCNLEVGKQCCKAANEANRKLGMIREGSKQVERDDASSV